MSLMTKALRHIEETQPEMFQKPDLAEQAPTASDALPDASPVVLSMGDFAEFDNDESLQRHKDLLAALRPGLQSIAFVTSGSGTDISRLVMRLGLLWSDQNHSPVLIVDCDTTRRALTREFGLDDTPGVLNMLHGPDQSKVLPVDTSDPRIQIIPVGQSPNSVDERTLDTAVSERLKSWKTFYPLTLLHAGTADAPPSRAFVSQSKATVLVVPPGAEHLYRARICAEDLRLLDANLAGCVLLEKH